MPGPQYPYDPYGGTPPVGYPGYAVPLRGGYTAAATQPPISARRPAPIPQPPISARRPDPTFSARTAGVGPRRPNRPGRAYPSDDEALSDYRSDDDRRVGKKHDGGDRQSRDDEEPRRPPKYGDEPKRRSSRRDRDRDRDRRPSKNEGSPPPPPRERNEETSDRGDHRPKPSSKEGRRDPRRRPEGNENDRRADSRTRTKIPKETTVDRELTAKQREGVKKEMKREFGEIKTKLELTDQIKKAPLAFRDELLSTKAFDRREKDAGHEGISRREDQRDALEKWKAGLLVAETEGNVDPKDVEKLQADWLAADKGLRQWRKGAQSDADNFEAYYDPAGKIDKLKSELSRHLIVMDSLAHRIGENSLAYLERKLPHFKRYFAEDGRLQIFA